MEKLEKLWEFHDETKIENIYSKKLWWQRAKGLDNSRKWTISRERLIRHLKDFDDICGKEKETNKEKSPQKTILT